MPHIGVPLRFVSAMFRMLAALLRIVEEHLVEIPEPEKQQRIRRQGAPDALVLLHHRGKLVGHFGVETSGVECAPASRALTRSTTIARVIFGCSARMLLARSVALQSCVVVRTQPRMRMQMRAALESCATVAMRRLFRVHSSTRLYCNRAALWQIQCSRTKSRRNWHQNEQQPAPSVANRAVLAFREDAGGEVVRDLRALLGVKLAR